MARQIVDNGDTGFEARNGAVLPMAPLIGAESPVGAEADAIAHSSCLQVENDTLEQAIADVDAGRAGRICAPGKWVVWRGENGRACAEIKAWPSS